MALRPTSCHIGTSTGTNLNTGTGEFRTRNEMKKAKKLIGISLLSALAIVGGKYAPSSDSAFFLITLGITGLMIIPVLELEAYFRRNENENK